MPSLELHPLIDQRALAALYDDPYIARVGHDHRPAKPLQHDAVRYIGAYIDGELVGAFLIIESGFIELDAHVLLNRQALPYSRQLARLCMNQLFSDEKLQRISTYVIDGLTEARNFARKLGFKDEGFRRDACQKGGQLLGLHMLGMTRTDWKELQ